MTHRFSGLAAPGPQYGSWAVVTGASNGIGRAFAEALAAAGFNLVVASRGVAALTQLAEELRDRDGVRVTVVACDLGEDEGIERLEAATDGLDAGLLVAAAGFGTSGPFLSSARASELDMLQVNCRAVVALAHTFGRRFVKRGGGGLVLLSSLLAFQGVPRAANYAATKAYVQTLAEGLGPELGSQRVAVLAVAPGPVASGFADRADMRMGRAQTPAEVAAGALKALGRRRTARPGFLAKFLEYSLALLPRSGRVRALGMVMNRMTSHQRPAASS